MEDSLQKRDGNHKKSNKFIKKYEQLTAGIEKAPGVCYNRTAKGIGDVMDKKISVLDIAIDDYTAKEAMQKTVEYMTSEPINTIRILNAGSLVTAAESESFKESVEQFDMVLAGDISLLETAGVEESSRLKETGSRIYLKMFFRYLNNNHKRVFLLTGSTEEMDKLEQCLRNDYRHIQIAGSLSMTNGDMADDMIVNEINGTETDCIISIIEYPLKEEFVLKNQAQIDARLWMVLGAQFMPLRQKSRIKTRLLELWAKRVLKKESEKHKKAVWKEVNENGI